MEFLRLPSAESKVNSRETVFEIIERALEAVLKRIYLVLKSPRQPQ